jgi:hypothetical protein
MTDIGAVPYEAIAVRVPSELATDILLMPMSTFFLEVRLLQ